MIELKDISKNFNGTQILRDFNLTLESGVITCLFGPSGVGKTTVANIAAGLIPIDGGSICRTGGSTLYSYVFQEPRLLEWYSVYDNIDFVLKDIYPDDKRHEVISSYLSMMELAEYKDYKPKELSGGMAQRVSLARAFAYPSNVLIMDEPFKGLDIKLKGEMMLAFQKLWSESKRTVLFITHDIDEAARLSDVILIIKGRPAKVIQKIAKASHSDHEIKRLLMD